MTTFKILTKVCGTDCIIWDGLTFEEAKRRRERLENIFTLQTYWIEEDEQVEKSDGTRCDDWDDFYPDRD